MNSNWSYSPETPNLGQIRWFLEPCDLDLWPWLFSWTSLLSLVITPENFVMIRWWEHSQKGVTDGKYHSKSCLVAAKKLNVTHLLKLLDKMYKYGMDQVSIVEDTEQTWFHPQTYGQGETNIPPFNSLKWGYNNKSSSRQHAITLSYTLTDKLL